MIPHNLIKEASDLYEGILNPIKMNISIYNDDKIKYDDWLQQKKVEFGNRYSHFFVLKLKD